MYSLQRVQLVSNRLHDHMNHDHVHVLDFLHIIHGRNPGDVRKGCQLCRLKNPKGRW